MPEHRLDKKYDIRILIVEPDPNLKTLYTEFLGERDLDVIVVSEGNECLSKKGE